MIFEIGADIRGMERATKRDGGAKLKPTTVRSANGTRTEMLPDSPYEVVKIFAERRKKSPALRVRARLAAEMTKRIGKK